MFSYLFGDANQIQNWWADEKELGSAWYIENPIVKEVPDARLRIPYGFHGDDAGMQGQEPVLVLNWNPLAVKHGSINNRLIFFMIKVASCTGDTYEQIYKVLAWSLTALATGVWPTCDHLGRLFGPSHHPARWRKAGKPLAGGMVGVWAEMRGDWKYLKESLHLQAHYGSIDTICHRCQASKLSQELLYTDFSQQATHRQTRLSHQDLWRRLL